MSDTTRGVVNPDGIPAGTITPFAPIPDFDRATLAPEIPRQWWNGTVPPAILASTLSPVLDVTAPAPAGKDCGCE